LHKNLKSVGSFQSVNSLRPGRHYGHEESGCIERQRATIEASFNQRQIYLALTDFFAGRFFWTFRFFALDFQLAAPARKLFLARL
jgi:hypothetical protein